MSRTQTATLLLLFLILPILGCFVYLKAQQKQIRKNIKHEFMASIPSHKLVKLTFSFDEIETKLRWEHSKEFEYKGEMYDVVRKEQNGDFITFYCWWDNEETALNKKLKGLTYLALNSNQQRKSQEHNLLNFFKTLTIPNQHEEAQAAFTFTNNKFQYFNISFKSYTKTIIGPPPQFC